MEKMITQYQLLEQIGKIEDEAKLDQIIEEAQIRKTYLSCDDLGKLIIDLIQEVDMGTCVVLRQFSIKGNKFVIDNTVDLLSTDVAGVGYANDEPINPLIQYIQNPRVEELWSLVQKVYDDCKLEEDLAFLNDPKEGIEEEVMSAIAYLDDTDHELYYELV